MLICLLLLDRPIHGLIFLFKWVQDDEPFGTVVQDNRLEKIFFAKQVNCRNRRTNFRDTRSALASGDNRSVIFLGDKQCLRDAGNIECLAQLQTSRYIHRAEFGRAEELLPELRR